MNWWWQRSWQERAALVAVVLAVALVLSSCTMPSNSFAVHAISDVISIEPSCNRELTWDLGSGTIRAVSAEVQSGVEPRPTRQASLTLRTGSRAELERIGDRYRVRVTHSTAFAHCIPQFRSRQGRAPAELGETDPGAQETEPGSKQDSPDPELRLDVDPNPKEPNAVRELLFEPFAPKACKPAWLPEFPPAEAFTHVLEGRIIVGATVSQGAGWTQGSAPILREGEVTVRSRAGWTNQGNVLLDEKLSAGSVIDSAVCFDSTTGPTWWDRIHYVINDLKAGLRDADSSAVCAAGTAATAFGFVRPHKDGGMEVQLHVLADRIGVRPHQGEWRQVAISLWSAMLRSSLMQSLIAIGGLVWWWLGHRDKLAEGFQFLTKRQIKAPRRHQRPLRKDRKRP